VGLSPYGYFLSDRPRSAAIFEAFKTRVSAPARNRETVDWGIPVQRDSSFVEIANRTAQNVFQRGAYIQV
jgi:hypothetical protein